MHMAETGEILAKPPLLTPNYLKLPAFSACQYVNILPILRERVANIQDQYLESLKSIFLEFLTQIYPRRGSGTESQCETAVKQPRDSRETRETPCARLAKQPRDSRETAARQPRDSRETASRQPRDTTHNRRTHRRSPSPSWELFAA